MKYKLGILVIFFCFACSQNLPSDKKNGKKVETTNKKESISVNKPDYLKLDTLQALEIVNSESKDVYQKYGIDVGGTCYACDVAYIVITGETIRFVNVCDEKVSESFLILSSVETKNGFKLSSTGCEFVFSKLSDASIYELKIKSSVKNP
jgi:hypothetical protein